MSKLERKSFKIFGETASEENIGQFGSAIAGTKLNTSDVEKIQELDAWSKGWESATIGENRYPAMQERTGVDKVFSYQIAYMLQQGIPEWGETTNYAIGSVVKIIKDGVVSLYTSLTNDNIGNAVTDATHWQVMGQANIDLSNLSEVGEKHFLGKSQITNCITEIPQRIKADVVDGTLTVYAGSVAIVPYGTTDRTSEFPVGSTFIHENFKVVDTQFADNKFFVWVELQSDISGTPTTTDTKERVIILYVNASTLDGAISSGSGTSPSGNLLYYNTNTNLVEYLNSGANTDGNLAALPLGISQADGTNKFASITQTFNGIGYIGSTLWIDKGVKSLIPNGRNEDGTLNNIEFTVPSFSITSNLGVDSKARLFYNIDTNFCSRAFQYYEQNERPIESAVTSAIAYWYNPSENVVYRLWKAQGLTEWYKTPSVDIGHIIIDSSNAINSLNSKQPFRAVDYSDVHVKTYVNGTSWYRIHPDGWIEQGGVYSFKATTASTVNLIKPFRDTNYTLFAQAINLEIAAYSDGYQHVYGKTTTSFKRNSYRAGNANWYACGY